MSTDRNQLTALIRQGAIDDEHVEEALELALPSPKAREWSAFFNRLLLTLGILALAASLIFFIAYNWAALGKFSKFGGIQLLIVAAIGAYCFKDSNKLSSRLLLAFSALCVGVLLALYGQTYQTGADPWQLFFSWALLILPWVLLARLAAFWLLWLGLINVSLSLVTEQGISQLGPMFSSGYAALWCLFIFNASALALWEHLNRRYGITQRWPCRLLAIGVGVPASMLAIAWVLDTSPAGLAAMLAWLLWIGVMYAYYRELNFDLFMLAGVCLSIIAVSTTFLAQILLDRLSGFGFLLLALLLIGMGSVSSAWLRRLHHQHT